MIPADQFLNKCRQRGFTFFTGTPCSYLKPIINYVIDNREFQFVGAVNEGDAVAMASGAVVGGRSAVVMFQNSGLGNAVNPLTSLAHTFQIPFLILVTHRGEPGGKHDEPQHQLMGTITTDLLNLMGIEWSSFPSDSDHIDSLLDKALNSMQQKGKPYAFVVRKGDVADYQLQTQEENRKPFQRIDHEDSFSLSREKRHTRAEALAAIQSVAGSGSAVIATTGYAGRELYELEDRSNQLYMVGSMGCALPLGLGVALARPDITVHVVDGDGALLMRTGTMATVGMRRPRNLIHILLDNEAHESTGGQSTGTSSISFAAIAKGFGYPHAISTDHLETFAQYLRRCTQGDGPFFIHMKIRQGILASLGRPGLTPVEVKRRFMDYLAHNERKENNGLGSNSGHSGGGERVPVTQRIG